MAEASCLISYLHLLYDDRPSLARPGVLDTHELEHLAPGGADEKHVVRGTVRSANLKGTAGVHKAVLSNMYYV